MHSLKLFFRNIWLPVLLLSGRALAQTDSLLLEPLLVKGFGAQHYMAGLKVQRLDSASLAQYGFQNLVDLLGAQSNLAFRNYGPGQLSTVSFRGTSANHTAVLWNGLNINAPSLGQTDFSTIPVVAFDAMRIQYGSSASLVGSDAVGGSILLDSEIPSLGSDLKVGYRQASFDNRSAQLAGRYASQLSQKWRLAGKTALYHTLIPNDYPYSERQGTALLPTHTKQNGLVQDLYFLSDNQQEVSAHLWITDNQITLVPKDTAGREFTSITAYRAMLKYRWANLVASAAWVRDLTDYGKGALVDLEHSEVDRLANRLVYEYRWNLGNGRFLNTMLGGEFTHYRARLENYSDPLITENRGDLFLLTRMQATERMVLALNLRKAYITRYSPPLTPSLGVDYHLLRQERHSLSLKGNVSKSYRVPTLNERYWSEIGNPDIRPEAGWNKEVGLESRASFRGNQQFTTSISLYHNRVKDWTYWNPSKRYFVENLQQVLAQGIELDADWKWQMDNWALGATGGYAYTHSTQEKAYDAYSGDVVGKQLMFVPRHQAHLSAYLQSKLTRLTVYYKAASRQYTTFDNTDFLPGYGLINVIGSTKFSLGQMWLGVQMQINNLSNTYYLNVRNNAMPGRNYALSLTFELPNINKEKKSE
ncbi:TonB-dependent receptor plug domain-containing protein [Dyadobacter tibetensis]|uniref:TonB-dependent receptor plug domain-containing protein n=1 Tax=Dyadobacter tibetensis TaxID=1211851 RepID=UPI0004700D96|nr:TonB-dependent receptor [Dyadobacter tibetensis]